MYEGLLRRELDPEKLDEWLEGSSEPVDDEPLSPEAKRELMLAWGGETAVTD